VVVSLSTLFAWVVFGRQQVPEQVADVVMVYLLGVVIVSLSFGYGPSLLVAVLSVVSFEFFFIPPAFSFAVQDLRHSPTFLVMFVVAFVVSHLAKRIRDQADAARRATLRAETEQLRNALLSSISHDLRTPLTVVTGATSALLGDHAPTDEAKRRTLIMTAHEEALRLNRLVANLLDMTRLDAGALKVKKELQPLEEVVGSALYRLEDRLRGRAVGTNLPGDLPLVPFDAILIEQVLINLIENATKYAPPGGPIDIAVRAIDGEVEVEVADRGPGVNAADAELVFEKFYRAREGEGGGVGLGLTICRGIVSAHRGRIWVDPRPQGGASFRFTLPLDDRASEAEGGLALGVA
jgi:two-component system sensor histidine kinase KdpD